MGQALKKSKETERKGAKASFFCGRILRKGGGNRVENRAKQEALKI